MRAPQLKRDRLKKVTRRKITNKKALKLKQAVSQGRIGIDSEAETQMKSLLRGNKYRSMILTTRMTCGRGS